MSKDDQVEILQNAIQELKERLEQISTYYKVLESDIDQLETKVNNAERVKAQCLNLINALYINNEVLNKFRLDEFYANNNITKPTSTLQ